MIALSRYMSAVAGTVPFTVLSAHRHTLTASAKLALVHITHLVRWLRNWVSMKIALKRIKTWFSDCLQRKSNFLFWHVLSHRKSSFLDHMHSTVDFVRCILKLHIKTK